MTNYWFCHAYIGLGRPVGMSPLHQQGGSEATNPNLAETLVKFKAHVEGLTCTISDTRIGHILICLQRYTIWVPTQIGQLLQQVSRVVVYYREQHD